MKHILTLAAVAISMTLSACCTKTCPVDSKATSSCCKEGGHAHGDHAKCCATGAKKK